MACSRRGSARCRRDVTPECYSAANRMKLALLSTTCILRTGEALRTCSRPPVRHFHERSTPLPTAPAPPLGGPRNPLHLRASLAYLSSAFPTNLPSRALPGRYVSLPSGDQSVCRGVRRRARDPGLRVRASRADTKPQFQADPQPLGRAACSGMGPDAYHPDQGRPADLALARCAGCQARLACLALALRSEDPEARSGWYGGLGPADRDALAASLDLDEPAAVLETDSATRAAQLRAAGWTISEIAVELGCSRRTVQRYLRKAAA